MATTDYSAPALDMLRRAQLGQTVDALRMTAAAFETMRVDIDVSDPCGDVAAYTRTVRADLEALEALGYRDQDLST